MIQFAGTARISEVASEPRSARGFISVSQTSSARYLHVSAKAPSVKDKDAAGLLKASLVTLVTNELAAAPRWSGRKAEDLGELAQRAVANVWGSSAMTTAGLTRLNEIATALALDNTGLSSIDGKRVAEAFSRQLEEGRFSAARALPKDSKRSHERTPSPGLPEADGVRVSACNRLMSPLYAGGRVALSPVTAAGHAVGGAARSLVFFHKQCYALGKLRHTLRIRHDRTLVSQEKAQRRAALRGLEDVQRLSDEQRATRLLGKALRAELSYRELGYLVPEWIHVLDSVKKDLQLARSILNELMPVLESQSRYGEHMICAIVLMELHPRALKDVYLTKEQFNTMLAAAVYTLEALSPTRSAYQVKLDSMTGGLQNYALFSSDEALWNKLGQALSTKSGAQHYERSKESLELLKDNSVRFEAFRRSGIASNPEFDGVLLSELILHYERTEAMSIDYDPLAAVLLEPVDKQEALPDAGSDSSAPGSVDRSLPRESKTRSSSGTDPDTDLALSSPPPWKDPYVREDRWLVQGRTQPRRRPKKQPKAGSSSSAVTSSSLGAMSSMGSPSSLSSSSSTSTSTSALSPSGSATVTASPSTGRIKRHTSHHDAAKNKAAPKWLRDQVGRPGKRWNHKLAISEDFSVQGRK